MWPPRGLGSLTAWWLGPSGEHPRASQRAAVLPCMTSVTLCSICWSSHKSPPRFMGRRHSPSLHGRSVKEFWGQGKSVLFFFPYLVKAGPALITYQGFTLLMQVICLARNGRNCQLLLNIASFFCVPTAGHTATQNRSLYFPATLQLGMDMRQSSGQRM